VFARAPTFADAIEERAEDLVRAEVENTGKPYSLTMEEEIGPMADQIRFFTGAARILEGKSAGEYLEGTPPLSAGSPWASARRSPRGTTR